MSESRDANSLPPTLDPPCLMLIARYSNRPTSRTFLFTAALISSRALATMASQQPLQGAPPSSSLAEDTNPYKDVTLPRVNCTSSVRPLCETVQLTMNASQSSAPHCSPFPCPREDPRLVFSGPTTATLALSILLLTLVRSFLNVSSRRSLIPSRQTRSGRCDHSRIPRVLS